MPPDWPLACSFGFFFFDGNEVRGLTVAIFFGWVALSEAVMIGRGTIPGSRIFPSVGVETLSLFGAPNWIDSFGCTLGLFMTMGEIGGYSVTGVGGR